MRNNTLVVSLIAPLPTWPSTGSKWSLYRKPGTLLASSIKRLRWMEIQKLNRFYNSATNILDGLDGGNNSSSCGPPKRGCFWTSSRHECIKGMSTTSGGLATLPSMTSKCMTPMSPALHTQGAEEAVEASRRSKLSAGTKKLCVLGKEKLCRWQKSCRSICHLQGRVRNGNKVLQVGQWQKTKMGNDPVKDPHREKGSWQKKSSAPKKRTGPS